MARTVNDYISLMSHALGKTPDSRHALIDTFNDAARYVFEYRPWAFRKTGPRYLSMVSDISISTADYSESGSTYTITKTGGFTNYRHMVGDVFSITAGAGVTVGEYRIAGKTSSDAITLVDDPGSTSTGDVSGLVRHSAVSAPTDFGQLLGIGIDNTRGLSGDFTQVRLVTPEDIVWMRENFFEPLDGVLYLAVQEQVSVSGVVNATPLWPCYPLPESGVIPRVTIIYRRAWTDMAAGTDIPPFPASFSRALMLAARAFAVNIENQSQAAEEPMLADELRRLASEQGGVQEDFGPIRGGALSPASRPEYVTLADVTFAS